MKTMNDILYVCDVTSVFCFVFLCHRPLQTGETVFAIFLGQSDILSQSFLLFVH